MATTRFDFVNVVVADRDLVVTSAHDHACRLEPREAQLAWYCDLDDGTPTGESDPAAFVRWVCPALRLGPSTAGTAGLEVRRAAPASDLGRLMQGFGRLTGRAPRRTPDGQASGRYAYTDPAGILDTALRQRIERWPSARYGDSGVRPAELSSIQRTGEGLVVESVSWWDSALALDHQLALAIDIADRLTHA